MDRNVYKAHGASIETRENLELGQLTAEAPEVASTVEPNPAEKLLRYFPVEALALYITLDPLVRDAFGKGGTTAGLWASLAITTLFCWLFLAKFWKVRLLRQRAISCGALILYVAAIGGPFATIDGFKPIFGVIAAVVASAFMLFVPAPEAPTA